MPKPSQYPLTLNRFFQLLREAVKYFPDSATLSLKTFAYLNAIDDLNKPNLGYDLKSAKSDYFLSKRYEKKKTQNVEFDFPLLAVIENNGKIKSLFNDNNQSQKIEHTIRILVLDLYKDSKEVTGTTSDRHIAEVYRDCRKILKRVAKYFSKVSFVTISKAGDPDVLGYYNTDLLDSQIANSEIDGYTVDNGLTSYFQDTLKANIENDLAIQDPISERMAAGIYTEIKIIEPECNEIDFNFDFTSNTYIQG